MRQEIGDDIGDLQKDKVHMKHGELEKWKYNFHFLKIFEFDIIITEVKNMATKSTKINSTS